MGNSLFPALSCQVPIVDKNGNPLPFFQRFLQQLQAGDNIAVSGGVVSATGGGVWGSITGTLSAQADLETELDARVKYADFTNFAIVGGKLNFWEFGGPSPSVAGPGGLFSIGADDVGSGQPYMIWTNADNINSMILGLYSANGRFSIDGTKAYEFSLGPYVTTHKIYHEGILSFGTGLNYNAGTGVLTISGVTYAEIQNVSATDKVLGRSSAGAGVIEEIPCTAAGRALIAGANAAAQRTTLGVYSTTAVDTAVTPYESSPTKPAAADFTLQNGAGGTNGVAMADFARGVSILQNATPGASGQIRFARHNTVAAGQAFTMTARMQQIDPSQAYGQAQQDCLILRNSANGRMILMGGGGSDANIYVQIFSSYTSGQLGQYTAFSVAHQFPWRQITVDAAGNIKFFVSRDGYYWVPGAAGTTIGNYLLALDEVGFGMQSIPNVATPHGVTLHSFTFV